MSDLRPAGSTVQEVLPGNPDDLDHLAGVLDNYVDGATDAARHLRRLDSGSWVGEAADAFWSSGRTFSRGSTTRRSHSTKHPWPSEATPGRCGRPRPMSAGR